jgi:hypothetical protein
MWQSQPLRLYSDIIVKQNIYVDNPIGITLTWRMFVGATHLTFNGLRLVQQLPRGEGCPHQADRIREDMLTPKSPWFALDVVGHRQHLAHLLTQQIQGAVQLSVAISQVGTKAEKNVRHFSFDY